MPLPNELVAKLGLDNSAFERGLASSKVSLLRFAADTAGILKSALAGGAVAAFANSLANLAERITSTAESLGVGTDFLQGFQDAAGKSGVTTEKATAALERFTLKLGEAREGNVAVAATFKQLGVALSESGNLRSTEDILLDVSERLKQIPDASERARISVELFGKAGLQMAGFLSKGRQELRGLIDDADKLSGETLENIREAAKNIEDTNQAVQVGVGNGIIGGLARFAQFFGALSARKDLVDVADGPLAALRAIWEAANAALDDVTRLQDRTRTEPIIKAGPSATQLERLSDALKKLGEVDAEIARRVAEPQQRLAEIAKQRADAEKIINTRMDVGEDAIAAKTKAAQDLLKLTQEELEVQQAIEKSQMQQASNAQRLAELKAGLQNAVSSLSTAQAERSRLSVQELATSNLRFTGSLGQDQRKARQIAFLERLAELDRQYGYLDSSQKRFSAADALRQTLSENVKLGDRDPFLELRKDIARTQAQMADFLKREGERGINIKPHMGR